MMIQNLMIAAIQNLRKLLRSLGNKPAQMALHVPVRPVALCESNPIPAVYDQFQTCYERILTFLKSTAGRISLSPDF